MSALELKVPPVAVVLTFAGFMWLVARAFPALAFAFAGRVVLSAILAGVGVAVALVGVVAFRRASTTVNPTRPETASALVTSGIYRLSRNPMYLGLLLVLTGWAVALAHPVALLFLPAFMAYMNRFQIGPEERALQAEFGPAFDAYARSVRRWL